MAFINFGSDGQRSCPVCLLTQGDPADHVASGIALGCVSAVIAESEFELGELFAFACMPHQERLGQLVITFSNISGIDYNVVLRRLGALPGGPPPQETLIHLVKKNGDRTLCGRSIMERFHDKERFVYPDKIQLVNCADCLKATQGP